jgi:hypothetical protein
MKNLNVNQEMNFEEMAGVVGGNSKKLSINQCNDLRGLVNAYFDAMVVATLASDLIGQLNAAILGSDVGDIMTEGEC